MKQIILIVNLLFLVPYYSFGQEIHAISETLSIGGADGVAIWLNPEEPSNSIIIAADPWKGLGTFTLQGDLIEVKNFGGGGAAEVDVRYDFPLGTKKIPIIVSANNQQNTIRIFTFEKTTHLLKEITGSPAQLTINAYGSCLYHSKRTNTYYVFITSREGLIEQWELVPTKELTVDAKRVREINIIADTTISQSPKTEACVADDQLGWVYFSQEEECNIWKYPAEPDGGNNRILVDSIGVNPGDNIEGLAIYQTNKKEGYLIASCQGSWTYKIYDRRENNIYIDNFQLIRKDSLHTVEAHDCIELQSNNFGESLEGGLMLSQSHNTTCGSNYQLVPWKSIAEKLNLLTKPVKE